MWFRCWERKLIFFQEVSSSTDLLDSANSIEPLLDTLFLCKRRVFTEQLICDKIYQSIGRSSLFSSIYTLLF